MVIEGEAFWSGVCSDVVVAVRNLIQEKLKTIFRKSSLMSQFRFIKNSIELLFVSSNIKNQNIHRRL